MDWQLIRIIVPPTIGFFLVGHGLYAWLSGRTTMRPAAETILIGVGVALVFLPGASGPPLVLPGAGIAAILAAVVSAAARRATPAKGR